jgi:SAM-dependent methyltransferase
MQERYLARRAERFAVIAGLIRATQGDRCSIVDLGCGPGSLSESLLEAVPEAAVTGLDYDPAMLCLARARLERFGTRAVVSCADLRDDAWTGHIAAPVDAVVSATALHWLTPCDLEKLYARVAALLRPGGIFLNADHVAAGSPAVQKLWEVNRSRIRAAEAPPDSDDWNGFFAEYGRAVGVDIAKLHATIANWEGEGPEEGLPLSWHFDKLRAAGFAPVECFWRLDCDAIYGGIRR